MKYCALFIFVTTSISTFAQPSSLNMIKRSDADPPYIVKQYQCDFSKMTRRGDGSTFGPVLDSPAQTNLAVTSDVYESLSLESIQKWLAYMDTDKEVALMKKKIKEFENSGNIPAMKHWEEKLLFESQVKKGYIKGTVFFGYMNKVKSDNFLKTRHEPPFSIIESYASFDEMSADSHNYCNTKKYFQ